MRTAVNTTILPSATRPSQVAAKRKMAKPGHHVGQMSPGLAAVVSSSERRPSSRQALAPPSTVSRSGPCCYVVSVVGTPVRSFERELSLHFRIWNQLKQTWGCVQNESGTGRLLEDFSSAVAILSLRQQRTSGYLFSGYSCRTIGYRDLQLLGSSIQLPWMRFK